MIIYLPFANQRQPERMNRGRGAVGPAQPEAPLAGIAARPVSDRAAESGAEPAANPNADPPANSAADPAGLAADPGWTEAAAILRRPSLVWTPAMVADARGRAHLVWEEDGRIMHATRAGAAGPWSEAISAAVGDSPRIAVDAQGELHVLMVNRFEERRQVYHLRWDGSAWSLPAKVSHSQHNATAPALAPGSGDRPLLAAWSEIRGGGEAVIYRAFWDGRLWHSGPVPQARGQGVALDRRGETMILAWHARPAGSRHFDVYAALEERDGGTTGWSLPENVSADARADQSAASMRVRGDQVELAWEHVDPVVSAIGHARRVDEAWLGGAPAFGIGGRAPRMAEGGGSPSVIWRDEAGLRSATAAGPNAWWVAQIPRSETGRDPWAGHLGDDPRLQLIWVQDGAGDGSWVFSAEREPCDACRLLLPSLKTRG